MNQEQILKVENSIKNMEEKTLRIYFLVQDTKGNAKASVRYIYQMAMALKNSGYNPTILHEKPDYFGVLMTIYLKLYNQVKPGLNLVFTNVLQPLKNRRSGLKTL